jgi:hypothetical protein
MSTQGFRKSSQHQSRAPANPRSTHNLATGRRHRSVHSPDSEPCCGNTPPFDLKSSSHTAAASSTSCFLEVPRGRDYTRLHSQRSGCRVLCRPDSTAPRQPSAPPGSCSARTAARSPKSPNPWCRIPPPQSLTSPAASALGESRPSHALPHTSLHSKAKHLNPTKSDVDTP